MKTLHTTAATDQHIRTSAENVAQWAQDALLLTTKETEHLALALLTPAVSARSEASLRGGVALLITATPSAFEAPQERLNAILATSIARWTWGLREPDRCRIRAAWQALTAGEER